MSRVVEVVDDDGVLGYLVFDGMVLVAHVECEEEAMDMARQIDEDNESR